MSKNSNEGIGCGVIITIFLLWCGISAIIEGKYDAGIPILFITLFFIVWAFVPRKNGKNTYKQVKIIHSEVDDMSGEEYERYCGEIIKTMNNVKKIQYTPITNDYGADIIAYSNDGTKAVIQCKRYKGKVNNTAVQEVVAALAHYNADKAIIMTNSTLTENARLLAKENGVKVIENFR